MPRGELFILSAPSGAGKTSLIQRMLVDGRIGEGLEFSVSHTCRAPRRDEVDGRDYHFVDRETFDRLVAEGAFLEWAEVHGKLYGTAAGEVLPRLERGVDVLLDIDVQGADQVMERIPEAIGIFILPPSFEALERRLRARGLDGPREIAGRLSVSLWETARYENYQYVIINDDLDRASEALAAVILEKRHRLDRMRERVEKVLSTFPDSANQLPAPGSSIRADPA